MTIIEKIEKAGWDVKKEGKELFIQKYSGEGGLRLLRNKTIRKINSRLCGRF